MNIFISVLSFFFILFLTLQFIPQNHMLPTKVYSAKQAAAPLLSSNFVLAPEVASSSSSSSSIFSQQLIDITGTPASHSATGSASEITVTKDFCLNVPVIMYHHVQPMKLAQLMGHPQLTVDNNVFEQQMQYLVENGYQSIAAHELIDALYNRQTLPEKSIIITLDDAYEDNYTYAFLTAKKYQITMNFMIPTGLIDTPGYMKWDHLKEMTHSPFARLYNHTTSHAPLDQLSQDEVRYEVVNATTQLQNKLNISHNILAYPFGSYSDEAIETITYLGIKGAFTTTHGQEHCLSNVMKLPRYHIDNKPLSEYGL